MFGLSISFWLLTLEFEVRSGAKNYLDLYKLVLFTLKKKYRRSYCCTQIQGSWFHGQLIERISHLAWIHWIQLWGISVSSNFVVERVRLQDTFYFPDCNYGKMKLKSLRVKNKIQCYRMWERAGVIGQCLHEFLVSNWSVLRSPPSSVTVFT